MKIKSYGLATLALIYLTSCASTISLSSVKNSTSNQRRLPADTPSTPIDHATVIKSQQGDIQESFEEAFKSFKVYLNGPAVHFHVDENGINSPGVLAGGKCSFTSLGEAERPFDIDSSASFTKSTNHDGSYYVIEGGDAPRIEIGYLKNHLGVFKVVGFHIYDTDSDGRPIDYILCSSPSL